MARMRETRGFTLLELLVVVAILSSVAVAAFGLMSEDRTQVRIDDTRNRLKILRRAALGVEAPVWNGQMRLSGYVADNGRLPMNIRDLLDPSQAPLSQQGVTPELFPHVDTQCLQQHTGTPESLEEARLLKGHRGNYLAGVAHGSEFRDGWGNIGQVDDTANFGWIVTPPASEGDDLIIESLGADNAPNQATGAEAEIDQQMKITASDWKVKLAGWGVELRNVGATEINDLDDVSLTLMVFENIDAPTGRWRQLRSNGGCTGGSLPAGGSCLLTFADVVECGTSKVENNAEVPLGRHALVLTAGNSPYEYGPIGQKRRAVALVDFFSSALPPNLVWGIYQP